MGGGAVRITEVPPLTVLKGPLPFLCIASSSGDGQHSAEKPDLRFVSIFCLYLLMIDQICGMLLPSIYKRGTFHMPVTLQQIADRAGVSRGTVDRALKNRGRIKPEVAEKIRALAEEMGYTPNLAGRALAHSKKRISIGVVIQNYDTRFMKLVCQGVEEEIQEMRRLGAHFEKRLIRGINPERCAETITELADGGVNGILVTPSQDLLEQRAIDYCVTEKNIPVFTFNSDSPNSKRINFHGENSRNAGEIAAGIFSEIMGRDEKILLMSGYPGVRAHIDRCEGFTDEINKIRPDLRISAPQYMLDSDRKAEAIVRRLYGTGFYEGIYAASAGVVGIVQALREMNLTGRVKVVSMDLVEENFKELRDRNVNFLIGIDGHLQGSRTVRDAFDYLMDGVELQDEKIYDPLYIKIRYNID